MSNKNWELEDLIAMMKKERVQRVVLGSLQVELHPSAFIPTVIDTVDMPQKEELMTDEEILYGSSPYLDVIQASKAARREMIEKETALAKEL